MTRERIAVVVGTRPDAIKMAPVYLALRNDPRVEAVLIATAQHRHMLHQVLSPLKIEPDVNLDLMRPNQTPAELTARVLTAVQTALAELRPDAVLVHGDTTTCLGAALAAFYQRIPLGHVEAGLRTYDFRSPWPEEMNRRLVDPLCRWCFAPTPKAAENLAAERIPEENIFVTGNTGIDALLAARDLLRRQTPEIRGLAPGALQGKRLILVTSHRRENFGKPLRELCLALRDVAAAHQDVAIVYPCHPNPNVRRTVGEMLTGRDRIHVIEPLEYFSFVYLMGLSHLIITDSGGIQEEAPALGKPVLVTRTATERPEAVSAGVAKLVGTDRRRIVAEAGKLLSDAQAYAGMCGGGNPFGNRGASRKIVEIICRGERMPAVLARRSGNGIGLPQQRVFVY